MDPGEGARLIDDWWVWQPTLPPQTELHLSASGATVSPWTLCVGDECTRRTPDRSPPCSNELLFAVLTSTLTDSVE